MGWHVPGIYYAPLKVIKKTNLWMPAVALVLALIFGGISVNNGRNATLLENHGVLTQGLVTGRERRETRDSDGNRSVDYYVSYRFSAGGRDYARRVEVRYAFYASVRENQPLTIRYHAERPSLHEYDIGSYRRAASEAAGFSGLGVLAAIGLLVWIARRSGALFRALRRGEVRRAEVVAHVTKPRRGASGGRYGRLRWRDEQGQEGTSGIVPMLDVVSHPVGSRISVVIDPKSGKGYWEEELAGGGDGMVNPFS